MIIKGDKSVIRVCHFFSLLCVVLTSLHVRSSFVPRSLILRCTSFILHNELDLPSFVLRSIFVRSSFGNRRMNEGRTKDERRPNEERTRNYRKTIERLTRIVRDAFEMRSGHSLVGLYISSSKNLLYQYPSIQLTQI